MISFPFNLIFSLVTDLVILLDLSKVGFPNFLQVCRFMIVKSDPKYNYNFIFLCKICTCTYLLIFNWFCSFDFVFLRSY